MTKSDNDLKLFIKREKKNYTHSFSTLILWSNLSRAAGDNLRLIWSCHLEDLKTLATN